jgi:hypothetical protein
MNVNVPRHSASVCDAVILTSVTVLRSYETPDALGVSKITQSIDDSGLLFDPIVADLNRGLLIDGHHRCEALRALGIGQVAAFDTDYFSSAVEVRGWVRASDAPVDEMKRAFSRGSGRGGDWRVIAIDDEDRIIATRRFERASVATDFVQWLCEHLEGEGWRVDLEVPGVPPQTHSSTSLRFYVDPVVGKPEVWAAAESGMRFPNEVNRHLIHERPLALGIPLERLRDQDQLTTWLRERLGSPERTVVRPGGTHVNGRYYEETVVTPADVID